MDMNDQNDHECREKSLKHQHMADLLHTTYLWRTRAAGSIHQVWGLQYAAWLFVVKRRFSNRRRLDVWHVSTHVERAKEATERTKIPVAIAMTPRGRAKANDVVNGRSVDALDP